MVRKAAPLIIAPLGVWAISLPIPFFSMNYFLGSLLIMILYLLFILFIDVTGKNKSSKTMSYAGYISLLLTGIFFGGPAFKLSSHSLFLQMVMVGVALLILFFAQKYNKIIADSLTGQENRNIKFLVVYYGFAALIIIAGGGGYFMAADLFADRFGMQAMQNYFSIVLLLIGYLVLIASQSATSRFKTFKN
ncbi:hypothetical protein [Bacillus sp. B15-48]|uniref:hypothetical protein n=1 Tax=Bacillus sp. B15-48 TaxID=1548601 RepID=UPI00193F4465|nr:hypothetical protein [Bacillus sp. B15-48]MBM4763249.1 hypothetical protein [Bacillus sp. B15-48]